MKKHSWTVTKNDQLELKTDLSNKSYFTIKIYYICVLCDTKAYDTFAAYLEPDPTTIKNICDVNEADILWT